MDVIYDQAECYFSYLIDLLRSDASFTILKGQTNFGKFYRAHMDNTKRPFISIFDGSDLMIYLAIWYNFMLVKTKFIDIVFSVGKYFRLVHNFPPSANMSIYYLIPDFHDEYASSIHHGMMGEISQEQY